MFNPKITLGINDYINLTLSQQVGIRKMIWQRDEPSIHHRTENTLTDYIKPNGAEKLDHNKIIAYSFGGVIIFIAIYKAFILPKELSLNFITPKNEAFLLSFLEVFSYRNQTNSIRVM